MINRCYVYKVCIYHAVITFFSFVRDRIFFKGQLSLLINKTSLLNFTAKMQKKSTYLLIVLVFTRISRSVIFLWFHLLYTRPAPHYQFRFCMIFFPLWNKSFWFSSSFRHFTNYMVKHSCNVYTLAYT